MDERTMSATGTLIPKLSDELALLCLARVPRQYHAILSEVSKPIRAAVASLKFFEIRSHLGVSEEVFIVRVRAPFHVSMEWFALYRTPQGNSLKRPLPPHPLPGLNCSAAAAVGNTIYVFGGWTIESVGSSRVVTRDVWALDCRSNVWSRRESMSVKRGSPLVAVIDRKIYLIGGSALGETFAEVLDVSTGQWDSLPDPPVDRSMFGVHAVGAEGGVIRVWGDLEELKFDPARWEWSGPIPLHDMFGTTESWCLFKGVLYAYDVVVSRIKRLDRAGVKFKEVEGVEQGLPSPRWVGPKLLNVGGRKLVAIVGRGSGSGLDYETIPTVQHLPEEWRLYTQDPFEAWFAEIKVSEEEDGAMGQVVWLEKVLSERWPDPVEGVPYPGAPYHYIFSFDWNLFQLSL